MAKNQIERILSGRKALSMALTTPEILNSLRQMNIDEQKLQDYIKLSEEVEALITLQKKEFGEQLESTEAFNRIFDQASQIYSNALKIARVVFRDDLDAQGSLLLNGIRNRSFSGWYAQVTPFYSNLLANADYLKAMSGLGYSADKLQQEFDLVKQVEPAALAQQKEKRESVDATTAKDTMIDKFDTIMSDFKTVCKVTFGKNSDNFKKLGF